MRNIKLTLEYDGTNYAGWQFQRNQKPAAGRSRKKTVQEVIEQALSQILQEQIKVVASGRTDAGVHAQGQVANFKTSSPLSCAKLHRGLNAILPSDIRVKKLRPVPLAFHARFQAKAKVYRYTIVNHSFVSPFLSRYVHLVKSPLDVHRMRQASRYFLGRQCLRSFQAADRKERFAVRTIKLLNIRQRGKLIYLDIEADGFLYRMARNIVGTLIEVGRGRLTPRQVKQILAAKNRIYAGPCAPARGLTLVKVKYK